MMLFNGIQKLCNYVVMSSRSDGRSGRDQEASEAGRCQDFCTRVAPRTRESQNSQRPPTPVPFTFDRDDLFARPQDLTTVDNPLHNRQNARCLRPRCPCRQVHPELLVYTLGAGEEFSHKRWSCFPDDDNNARPHITQQTARPIIQHCAA